MSMVLSPTGALKMPVKEKREGLVAWPVLGPPGKKRVPLAFGGGDELVGAAVGEVGGAGLLADGGVGAGGGEEFEALVFGGGGAPAGFRR